MLEVDSQLLIPKEEQIIGQYRRVVGIAKREQRNRENKQEVLEKFGISIVASNSVSEGLFSSVVFVE